ncbi:glyoxalase/bleomycin resistance protein/dioxygenase [Coprinopsis sp. MPI-PUGE-AT-0042]|nr:glyoxalase/bleomycin resistance protein/dioxygenase [Coprinopsis sp. MPI-PUGE-AT-0042]
MPLHHIGLVTPDLARLAKFYVAALKPLGYQEQIQIKEGSVRGYGQKYGGPDFWLAEVPKSTESSEFLHLAFAARTRNQVRAFHAAALAAGGKCNGPPGPRPQYFFTYYGAFILDPEGRNIEAVCLKPGFWAEEWSWPVWGLFTSLIAVGIAYYFNLIPANLA